jgi:hypothetical protein
MECPITCPCRRSVVGVFLLTCCVWAALHSQVFLGSDFGILLARLLLTPHVVSPALAGWAVAAAVALWIALTGIRPALEEGDGALLSLKTLAATVGGAAALSFGWYPLADLGAVWTMTNKGLYVAVIAAGAADIALALTAHARQAGYNAGLCFDPREWEAELDRKDAEIALLAAERDELTRNIARLGTPAHDLQEVLRYPGVFTSVRNAVVKALHRDAHPGIREIDARACDERLKKALAVFEHIAGPGR